MIFNDLHLNPLKLSNTVVCLLVNGVMPDVHSQFKFIAGDNELQIFINTVDDKLVNFLTKELGCVSGGGFLTIDVAQWVSICRYSLLSNKDNTPWFYSFLDGVGKDLENLIVDKAKIDYQYFVSIITNQGIF